MTSERVARFDDFELDRHTLELRRAGVPVKLQQQPARVLALLTEHPGELVTRELLRKSIWGDDTFVDFEHGLNFCIRQIRTVLGDTAAAPRYVETLRGRGYRFIGTLGTNDAAAPAPPRPVPWRRPVIVAVIVLMLVAAGWTTRHFWVQQSVQPSIGVASLTSPPAERQWAEALRAQIISRLSIASRTPVVDIAAGSSTQTRWLVEGRVDRSPEQYRVTMVLRDTRDGTVAWSDIFAGSPGDWVDAQSEMADRMTEIIRYRIEGPSAGMPKRRQRLHSAPLSKR